jgi:catechol 2,3-dioxygenase-like lactoylglutathione lyase family enzyme
MGIAKNSFPLRFLLMAGVLVTAFVYSGAAGGARELAGDVAYVKTIGFTVADLDRETDFFVKVLQFEKVAEFRLVGSEYDRMQGVFNVNMRIVHLQLGDQIVELTSYVAPPTGRPIPVPSFSNDLWFEHMAIVVRDMDAAYKRLQDANIRQISAQPITIPQSNRGELIYFPPGKGNSSWQQPSNRLMLGIDHTAMTVGSTEQSVAFYKELLGFNAGAATFNKGDTQEVLDNLFNDTCVVTPMLLPRAPPHVEFLDYRSPPGGRPMPVDTKSNDLWHWQTTLVSKDLHGLMDRLQKAGAQFITPEAVIIPQEAQAKLGFKKSVMIRDPNGHALRLVEE